MFSNETIENAKAERSIEELTLGTVAGQITEELTAQQMALVAGGVIITSYNVHAHE